MKKRIISVALAALFLVAASSLPAGAITPGGEEHVNACNHVWGQIPDNVPIGNTFYPKPDGCHKQKAYRYTCTKCSATHLVPTNGTIRVRYHLYENKAYNNGHGPGNKHGFYKVCVYCIYRSHYTVTCYGPPCNLPD